GEEQTGSCKIYCITLPSEMKPISIRFLPFQPEQENDHCGEGHRDTEKVDSAHERPGHGLNFTHDFRTKVTAQISNRVDEADAAGGASLGREELGKGPEGGHVGFEPDEGEHETRDRQK